MFSDTILKRSFEKDEEFSLDKMVEAFKNSQIALNFPSRKDNREAQWA